MQLDLFIHAVENNRESQDHLNENREKFSNQCRKVLALLQDGVKLTTENAVTFGIRSLPRRILDLKRCNGIIVPSKWVTDQSGKRLYKEWSL